MKNGWNKQIVQILHEICDVKYLFEGNIISKLPKPVEITPEQTKKNFKYQEPYFYPRLFDESENVTFEVPPGSIKT